ncbi:MAG: hypothetical protein LW806_00785 [Planctomycetaceae bacterium]|nr:hypothetical protein [Planctomycetaceae bacterium]
MHETRLAPGLEFAFVYPSSRPIALDTVRLFGTPASGSTSTPGALDAGLVIEEVSTSGSVPYLLARNESGLDFLLLAGQIVKGGKQNRGINLDVLVSAGASTQIPVTCVEQGRWNGGPRTRFQHGGIEPLSVRTMKMRDAHACRRADRAVVADQLAVWDEIMSMERAVGARSASHDLLATLSHSRSQRASRADAPTDFADPGARVEAPRTDLSQELRAIEEELRALEEEVHRITSALANAPIPGPDESASDREALLHRHGWCERQAARLRTRRTAILRDGPGGPGVVSLEAIQAADNAAQGACGMLVFMRDEFIAGDVFADPAWFQHVYHDLRDSALLSWDVVRRTKAGAARTRQHGCDAEAQARGIMQETVTGEWTERRTVGHGTNLLLTHPTLDGAMIAGHDRTPLHMLLGTRAVPSVFSGSRGSRRRDLRNFPME